MGMNYANLARILPLVVSCVASAQTVLEVGKTVHGRIDAGRADSYALNLKSSDYIELLVEQTGVDILLRLASADGKQLQEVNYAGIGGTELLIHLADRDGNYQAEVLPVRQGASGEYAIRLDAQRPADAKNREAAEADTRFRQLVAEKSPDSAGAMEELAAVFGRSAMVRRQALAWGAAGDLHAKKFSWNSADEDYGKALGLWRAVKDRAGEGRILAGTASTFFHRSDFPKAIEYANQALAIAQDLHSGPLEASALEISATVYTRSGQPVQAVSNLERAVSIRRAELDRAGEASALSDLAYAHFALSQHETAVEYYEQALVIAHELGDRRIEGSALNGLGIEYKELGKPDKAIEVYERSLALSRELKDQLGEGTTIANLGLLYATIGEYEKSIKYHEQSLAMARAAKYRFGEGVELGLIGYAYRLMGQYETAIRYYQQGVAIARELKVRVGEGMGLNELGNAYSGLGSYQVAIGFYEQALVIERQVKNRAVESWILNDMGTAHLRLKQADKAIEYYNQALAIAREIMDRATEGEATNNLGLACLSLRQNGKAISYGEAALVIAREVKNRRGEHDVLFELMRAHQAERQPYVAIFYGKQAVNVVQSIRSDNRGLSDESRRALVDHRKETYRTLANLLISSGRLVEAQQVLNLLKEQEFFDYIRRDERAAGPSGRADFTAEEAEWADRYRGVSETLVAKGAEMEELRARLKKQPSLAASPDTKQTLDELQKDLEAGNRAFQQFLGELKEHFAAKPDRVASVDLRETEALKTDLSDLKHGSVAIYTLVAADRYVAILVTPRVQRAYESNISSEDLNTKIFQFREAIQDPRSDPRPLANELYRILIPGALASDLKQAHAATLMWSLDGPLRYVPISALYDGRQYLIEKYRIAVFTPASNARLKDAPRPSWRGVGFGVTEAHPGFDPLPGVAAELRAIIREKPGDQGVLNGRRLLDQQFTRAALDRELIAGFPVVHVASHFQFRPGDETRSFLLLGDGGQLTLADLKSADTIFAGVELLTLSACSTGLGDVKSSDGSEVEGFGVLAQRKGAKAVLASLWPVADESTALLMREFYRIRETNTVLTKLDALREAQLELLRGMTTGSAASQQRGLVHDPAAPPAPQGSGAPPRPIKDFRHPYFWAPFFLMGNWL
jgi:CHAT domain-containing protein/Tfp pilus assembly protein PilF